MKYDEAIAIITNPKSTLIESLEAVNSLTETDETPLFYLVECLKRKGHCAELAAMKLYKRTNRPRGGTAEDVILDYDDWLNYLRQKQII
jgi:hypothetical protein